MIYLELFLGFLKVGCFSFGGAYAAIPLIREVVLDYGWITPEMFSYMTAVSESTPGPIMINLATYVGATQAGLLGSIIATFAVAFPAFLIVLLIVAIFRKATDNKYFQAVLSGVKPCIVGIILAVGCYMIIENLFAVPFSEFSIRALIITAILALVYFGQNKLSKVKVSPIALIVISAVLGVVGYSI